MPFFIEQLLLSFGNYSIIFWTHNHLAQISPALVGCVIFLCILDPFNRLKGFQIQRNSLMQQVELFRWEFFVFNLCETPNFSSKMDWLQIDLEQSRETEVPSDKHGPSGMLSYNGLQRLEMKFLPLERTTCAGASSIPNGNVNVICQGDSWLISGTNQTQAEMC